MFCEKKCYVIWMLCKYHIMYLPNLYGIIYIICLAMQLLYVKHETHFLCAESCWICHIQSQLLCPVLQVEFLNSNIEDPPPPPPHTHVYAVRHYLNGHYAVHDCTYKKICFYMYKYIQYFFFLLMKMWDWE